MLSGIVGGKPPAAAFDPSQLSGLKGWYDSSSLTCTGGCSGTNVVTAILDKSSNGNNITTYGSPTFVASALNGYPAVYFIRTSTQYGLFASAINLRSGLTIFIVAKKLDTDDAQSFITGPVNSFGYGTSLNSSGKFQGGFKTGIAWFTFGNAEASSTAYRQANVTYKDYSAGGAGIAYRIDRNSDGGNATQTGAITEDETAVFYRPATTDFYSYINFVEMIIFDRVLNSTEIGNVETYLNAKYGI